MARKVKMMSPRGASTFQAVCSLRSDNISSSRSWILVDDQMVYLANQKAGEPTTGAIALSRQDFNRFVDWYNKTQNIKPVPHA